MNRCNVFRREQSYGRYDEIIKPLRKILLNNIYSTGEEIRFNNLILIGHKAHVMLIFFQIEYCIISESNGKSSLLFVCK